MADRRLKALTALTGLALVGVIGTGAVVGSTAAADDLTPRVRAAVTAAGFEDVQVDVVGREVTVRSGTLDELTAAIAAAETVRGVRSAAVDDAPGSVDEIDTTRPYLRLRRDGDRLQVLGGVREAASAADLKVAAARAFGIPVRGDLTIDPALPRADWTGQLPAALADLTGIDDLELTVDGDALEIAGTVDTATARDDLFAVVRDAVPSLTIALDVVISGEAA